MQRNTKKQQLDDAYDKFRYSNFKEAMELFDEIGGFDGEIGLVRCYTSLKDYKKASELLDKIKFNEKDLRQNRIYYETKSILLDRQKKYKDALDCLDFIIDQKNSNTQHSKARTLGDMGKEDEELELYRQIKKDDPSHANSYLSEAIVLNRKEQFRDAIQCLQPFFSKNAKQTFPHLRKRQVASAYAIAAMCFSSLLNEKNQSKLTEAELTKQRKKFANLALKYAQQSIVEDQEYAIGWATCAHAYLLLKEETGTAKKARECFEKARALDPVRFDRNHPLYREPGEMYERNDYDEYLFTTHLAKLIDYFPESFENNTNDAAKPRTVSPSLSYANVLLTRQDKKEDKQSATVEQTKPEEFPALCTTKQKEEKFTSSFVEILKKSKKSVSRSGVRVANSLPKQETPMTLTAQPEPEKTDWWDGETTEGLSTISKNAKSITKSVPVNSPDVPDSWDDEFSDEAAKINQSETVSSEDRKEAEALSSVIEAPVEDSILVVEAPANVNEPSEFLNAEEMELLNSLLLSNEEEKNTFVDTVMTLSIPSEKDLKSESEIRSAPQMTPVQLANQGFCPWLGQKAIAAMQTFKGMFFSSQVPSATQTNAQMFELNYSKKNN